MATNAASHRDDPSAAPGGGAGGRSTAVAIISWAIAAWMLWVFLGSLPYKFTLHPDTQHIVMMILNRRGV